MTSSEMFFRLDDKVAVVTGGGQGIGEAICRRLAAAGAKVAVFDRDNANAVRVADSLGGLALVGDVCSENDIAEALAKIQQNQGCVDILVNNAGITGKARPTWELTKFASLKRTCRKLGVRFWDYLQDRVRGLGQIPPLADLIRRKARQKIAPNGQAVPA